MLDSMYEINSNNTKVEMFFKETYTVESDLSSVRLPVPLRNSLEVTVCVGGSVLSRDVPARVNSRHFSKVRKSRKCGGQFVHIGRETNPYQLLN